MFNLIGASVFSKLASVEVIPSARLENSMGEGDVAIFTDIVFSQQLCVIDKFSSAKQLSFLTISVLVFTFQSK